MSLKVAMVKSVCNIFFASPFTQEWYKVITSKDATMDQDENENMNLFGLTLNLGSTDIQVREDVILVNFNGLVSSVGGSLGLFLGFSFYQFLIGINSLVLTRN